MSRFEWQAYGDKTLAYLLDPVEIPMLFDDDFSIGETTYGLIIHNGSPLDVITRTSLRTGGGLGWVKKFFAKGESLEVLFFDKNQFDLVSYFFGDCADGKCLNGAVKTRLEISTMKAGDLRKLFGDAPALSTLELANHISSKINARFAPFLSQGPLKAFREVDEGVAHLKGIATSAAIEAIKPLGLKIVGTGVLLGSDDTMQEKLSLAAKKFDADFNQLLRRKEAYLAGRKVEMEKLAFKEGLILNKLLSEDKKGLLGIYKRAVLGVEAKATEALEEPMHEAPAPSLDARTYLTGAIKGRFNAIKTQIQEKTHLGGAEQKQSEPAEPPKETAPSPTEKLALALKEKLASLRESLAAKGVELPPEAIEDTLLETRGVPVEVAETFPELDHSPEPEPKAEKPKPPEEESPLFEGDLDLTPEPQKNVELGLSEKPNTLYWRVYREDTIAYEVERHEITQFFKPGFSVGANEIGFVVSNGKIVDTMTRGTERTGSSRTWIQRLFSSGDDMAIIFVVEEPLKIKIPLINRTIDGEDLLTVVSAGLRYSAKNIGGLLSSIKKTKTSFLSKYDVVSAIGDKMFNHLDSAVPDIESYDLLALKALKESVLKAFAEAAREAGWELDSPRVVLSTNKTNVGLAQKALNAYRQAAHTFSVQRKAPEARRRTRAHQKLIENLDALRNLINEPASPTFKIYLRSAFGPAALKDTPPSSDSLTAALLKERLKTEQISGEVSALIREIENTDTTLPNQQEAKEEEEQEERACSTFLEGCAYEDNPPDPGFMANSQGSIFGEIKPPPLPPKCAPTNSKAAFSPSALAGLAGSTPAPKAENGVTLGAGVRTTVQTRCSYCMAPVKPDWKVCGNCGRDLRQA